MKRTDNIPLNDIQLIERAIIRVLKNHTRRRRLWRKLSESGESVRKSIEKHAEVWSLETGETITYEQAKEQLFGAIRGKEERKQLEEIIASDENKATYQNIRQYALWVKERIEKHDWEPDGYREFYINDGIRQKRRLISATSIRSQIFHWILILGIEPVVMRGMVAHTCASIPGRGAHYGRKFMVRWTQNPKDRESVKYCAKIDIKKFYQNIDQAAVKREFRRVIKDKTALWLIDTIVGSYPQGLPIGTYTSQWFANFILQRLDHYIKEQLRIKYCMRYMDDIVMFGRNKKQLHKALELISEFLKPYGLKIKENWQVFRFDYVVEETGIKITKQKRTDDIIAAMVEVQSILDKGKVKYKVIYRNKHKDTKTRKKTHKSTDQYKEIFIRIKPEEMKRKDVFVQMAVYRLNPVCKEVIAGTMQHRCGRDVDFMGFRFYSDHVTIRRKNQLRIRRLYAKAARMEPISAHVAAGCLSYIGQTKHTDSYSFKQKYMDKVINVKKLKEVVRYAAENKGKAGSGTSRRKRKGRMHRTGTDGRSKRG